MQLPLALYSAAERTALGALATKRTTREFNQHTLAIAASVLSSIPVLVTGLKGNDNKRTGVRSCTCLPIYGMDNSTKLWHRRMGMYMRITA